MSADFRALIAPLFARFGTSDPLSEAEEQVLVDVFSEVRPYPARGLIARSRVRQEESQLLLEGLVCRQADLPDGRRQILAIHVPGDFVDLHSFVLKSLDHDVTALTPARMGVAPHAALRTAAASEPHLARMLWFATAVDAAIHREWISSLGRSAAARVAHLLCELRCRLSVVGLADQTGCALPVTQIDIADATSLTPVHVNRTLRQLRETGIVEFRAGRLEIGDLPALERFAGFDPAYLYLDRTAR